MATAGGSNLGPPPIISLSSPLHSQPPPLTHSSPSSSSIAAVTTPTGGVGLQISGTNGVGVGVTSGSNGLRESQAPNPGDLSGIFSVVLNRQQHQQSHHPLSSSHHVRWPSFSMGNRSFWTKYCLLCTVCGSAACILAGIFLVVAALFRYYTTSIYYFETVPTYIPAILLSICGVSTIAFSCKRNRNIILLRITACWSLCSAALSSVITITTSLIHMNRLQTLKECVYSKNPPSCTCYSHSFGMQGPGGPETTHYLFENTPDCDVIHGILYSCLRAIFAISVVSVLLSIFLCMLLYQLIGHERKKAYWSRIRRINSDWSADFIACLARPIPRERSSLLPLMPSLIPGTGAIPMHGQSILPPPGWGPPPSYDDACNTDTERPTRPRLCNIQPTQSFAGTTSQGFTGGGFFNNRSSASFAFHGGHHPPPRRLRLVTSHSENSFRGNPDGLMCPHPFSPTITTVDPVSIFKQHQQQHQDPRSHLPYHHQRQNNHHYHHNYQNNHRHNPTSSTCTSSGISNCSIAVHNTDYLMESGTNTSPIHRSGSNIVARNFRGLSQSQVLHHSTREDDEECCMDHTCPGNHRSQSQLPQSSSFMTNASGRNSEFSITSLSMPDNSSMSITMKSSNDIPLNDNNSSSHCCNIVTSNSLPEDDDFVVISSSNNIEETGLSDQELSLTSNCTTSAEAIRHRHSLGGGSEIRRGCSVGGDGVGANTSSSSTGAVGLSSSGVPNTTSSEPKIINANNSFNTVVGQLDSNSVINSDTDIILNKKALEFWGSLKKHKNFSYYGGGVGGGAAASLGGSTSRRKRKEKSAKSLSKISSLPCSPFMNMRRKLFGPGGKSLECVQNLNYNFSYSMAPMEVSSWMVKANNDANLNNTSNASEEFNRDDPNSKETKRKGSSSSESSEKSDQGKKSTSFSKRGESFEDKGNNTVPTQESPSVAEVRPEVA